MDTTSCIVGSNKNNCKFSKHQTTKGSILDLGRQKFLQRKIMGIFCVKCYCKMKGTV